MAQTVLLVDDERLVRTVTSRMLTRLGYHVLCAADGNEALFLFRENEDDIVVVIVDLVMPDMDGEQTFLQLRSIKHDAVVILASGNLEEEMIHRFGDVGFAGFLQKPYAIDDLAHKLHEVMVASDVLD